MNLYYYGSRLHWQVLISFYKKNYKLRGTASVPRVSALICLYTRSPSIVWEAQWQLRHLLKVLTKRITVDIDSGGQPKFQEVLSLFVHCNSINVIIVIPIAHWEAQWHLGPPFTSWCRWKLHPYSEPLYYYGSCVHSQGLINSYKEKFRLWRTAKIPRSSLFVCPP